MNVKEILKECKVMENGELVTPTISEKEIETMQELVNLNVWNLEEEMGSREDMEANREFIELSRNGFTLAIVENFFKLRNK